MLAIDVVLLVDEVPLRMGTVEVNGADTLAPLLLDNETGEVVLVVAAGVLVLFASSFDAPSGISVLVRMIGDFFFLSCDSTVFFSSPDSNSEEEVPPTCVSELDELDRYMVTLLNSETKNDRLAGKQRDSLYCDHDKRGVPELYLMNAALV